MKKEIHFLSILSTLLLFFIISCSRTDFIPLNVGLVQIESKPKSAEVEKYKRTSTVSDIVDEDSNKFNSLKNEDKQVESAIENGYLAWLDEYVKRSEKQNDKSKLVQKAKDCIQLYQTPIDISEYRNGIPDVKAQNVPYEIQNGVFTNPQTYLPKLIDYLTGKKESFQSVKAIHDWICLNIPYDTTLTYIDLSWEGVLTHHKAVCDGYALLFEKMCSLAGIKAKYISGHAGNPDDPSNGHAWSSVRIDGRWYLLDCTWDAGWDGEKFNYSTDYLFLNPSYFIYNHYPNDIYYQYHLPLTTKEDINNAPTYSSSFLEAVKTQVISPTTATLIGGEKVVFEIKSDDYAAWVLEDGISNQGYAMSFEHDSKTGNYRYELKIPRTSHEVGIYASKKGNNGSWQPMIIYQVN